jgi:hypothetical protein
MDEKGNVDCTYPTKTLTFDIVELQRVTVNVERPSITPHLVLVTIDALSPNCYQCQASLAISMHVLLVKVAMKLWRCKETKPKRLPEAFHENLSPQ